MPYPRIALLLFSLFALAALSCGTSDDVASDTATPRAVADPSPTPEPDPTSSGVDEPTPTSMPEPTATTAPTPPPVVEQVVNVYWGGTVVNSTGTPERLLAGGRVITTASPARSAIEALLQGPNQLETEIGMFTAIPAGTTLLDLNITDRKAIIDLSAHFEQSSGSLAEFLRVGQVVFTLTQFDSVDAVTFRIDGEDRDALASHGIDVSSPVDRDDFEGIRALVLPERPYPGSLFRSGDSIVGESNTFEASVEWVVTNRDGLIIGEGSTTATDGSGTWGRFDVVALLDGDFTGPGAVIVFDTSAEDGSQINIVEYPIELAGP